MRLRFALLCAFLSAGTAGAHAADKLVPVEAFTEQQQFSMPRLSPDGKHLAVNVRIKRGDRTVPTMHIYSLPDLKIVSTIALTGYEIPVNFGWLNNERLVVEKGLEVGEREAPVQTGEVVAVNLDGSKPEYLYGYQGFKLSSRGDRYGDDYGFGVITHIPRSRDGHLFLGTHQWDGHHSMLYDVSSTNSVRKLIAEIPMKDFDFLVQNDDKPRFAYGLNDQSYAALFRRDDASGEWREVSDKNLGARFHPFAFTPDDRAFYASYSAEGGPDVIVREDVASGARTVVAKDALGSIDEFEYTAKPEVPFAWYTSVGVPKAHYLDETLPDAILHKSLSDAFPDSYVHFINFTDDGQTLLFGVESDRDPGSFYLYSRKTGKAEPLLYNMPDIDSAQMAQRRPVTFTARDGMQIAGYLTMPANLAKKKLPLVLLPHGGPIEIKDGWFFDSDAQFLASRGYAVLQVNFRGSEGRGPAFRQAGYHQWGGKMIDDLADGVKWAAAQPEIDGTRACVFGASYGGYAAMMLAAREPGMFKCAVGYAGLYDLTTIYGNEGIKGDARATNLLVRWLGNDPAELHANSPVYAADRIKIPVLLVHGGKDKRTPLDRAELMRDALTKAGNAPQWMLVENEGHGFYDAGHRKDFYERLAAFLDKHIGH